MIGLESIGVLREPSGKLTRQDRVLPTPRELMGTSSSSTYGFSFEMCLTLFISMLLDNCLVLFDFRLSPFGLHFGQYLGLRLSSVGHMCFKH